MIRLSICIPTYNGALHLNETLENVIAQIDECDVRETVEVVVCDNASQDATEEIVRTWMRRCPELVRYVRNERNLGFNANVNRALHEGRGEYVHLLGDDDLYCPGALNRMLKVLSNSDYNLVVLSNDWLSGADRRPRARKRDGYFPDGLRIDDRDSFIPYAWYRCWAVSNIVIKRECAIRCEPSRVDDWRHLDLALEVVANTLRAYCMPEAEPCVLIRIDCQTWLSSERCGDIYENCVRSLALSHRYGYSRCSIRQGMAFFLGAVDMREPAFWGMRRMRRLMFYWRAMWDCISFYRLFPRRHSPVRLSLALRTGVPRRVPCGLLGGKDDLEIMILSCNRAGFLQTQLESLCMQTVRGLDVIVVDNASTDNTREVVLRMQQEHPEHKIRFEGFFEYAVSNAESFRRTQRLARKKFVAVFRDDDVIHPQYIEKALCILSKEPDVVGISCDPDYAYCCNGANWQVQQGSYCVYPQREAPYWYLANNRFCFAAMVYRTSAYKELCIDAERYGKLFDNAMLLDLCTRGNIAKITDKMIRYRLHPGSDGNNKANALTEDNVLNLLELANRRLAGTGFSRVMVQFFIYRYGKSVFAWTGIQSCTWAGLVRKCVDRQIFSRVFTRAVRVGFIYKMMKRMGRWQVRQLRRSRRRGDAA